MADSDIPTPKDLQNNSYLLFLKLMSIHTFVMDNYKLWLVALL